MVLCYGCKINQQKEIEIMTEQERIEKLEKEVAELKEVIKNFDKRMREIFREEFQHELEMSMLTLSGE